MAGLNVGGANTLNWQVVSNSQDIQDKAQKVFLYRNKVQDIVKFVLEMEPNNPKLLQFIQDSRTAADQFDGVELGRKILENFTTQQYNSNEDFRDELLGFCLEFDENPFYNTQTSNCSAGTVAGCAGCSNEGQCGSPDW